MTKQLDLHDRVPPGFQMEYVAKGRPVAVRGAAADWPAVKKWNPAYLKERAGHHEVSQISLDFKELEEFSFGEYLDLLQEPPEDVGVLPYIRNKFLHDVFPELSADVGRLDWLQPTWLEKEPLASMLRVMRPHWSNWCELFISQPQVRYPLLHTDACGFHAWSVQVYGIKRYWVWPPLPDFKDTYCIGKDLDTILGVEPFAIEIGPGDAVVIPSNLPHVAESVTTSITIAGSYVDEVNWAEFSREFFERELQRELQHAS
jgi:hypothetical protein